MNTSHIEFVGSIPEAYDTHLGPLLFQHYGADLARRLDVPAGGRVLETACGTGISTEHLRGTLPDSVEIVATDLNDAMLDYARAKRSDLANVSFRQADALDLPFEDASFDAVACQFGLMFFPDKAAGMAEALRVLKSGGMLGFNVWDSLDANEIARVAHETIGTFLAQPWHSCGQRPRGTGWAVANFGSNRPIAESLPGILFLSRVTKYVCQACGQ